MKRRATFPNSPSTIHAQRGVAVIMALLLTTLAITIVASLFWQQQVQVRLIENQRLQLQKQWILRGALDWASLILREDAKYSSVDTLDEPWSVPLAETRLDQYVENGKTDSDIADTSLEGSISDAQARFNLTNLCPNGTIAPAAVATFERLLSLLHIDPALAQSTAKLMTLIAPTTAPSPPLNTSVPQSITESAQLQKQNPNTPPAIPVVAVQPVTSSNNTPQTMGYTQVEDMLAVPGWSPALLDKLKPYVVFLPRSTTININTASAEVIAALLSLSLADANTLVASRKIASFRDLADASSRLPNNTFISANNTSISSNYFLVNGKVRMNRARLDMQTLIERNGGVTTLLWIREF